MNCWHSLADCVSRDIGYNNAKFGFTCAISIPKAIVPKLMDLEGFTPSQWEGECAPEETEMGEANWNEQHGISMS